MTGWKKYPWWAMRLFGWTFLFILPPLAWRDGAPDASLSMAVSGVVIELSLRSIRTTHREDAAHAELLRRLGR